MMLGQFSPPHFTINKDGQLQQIRPLFNGVYPTIMENNPQLQQQLNDVFDINKQLSNFYQNNVTKPIEGFFARNDVNLVVFFIGIVVILIGLLEARTL